MSDDSTPAIEAAVESENFRTQLAYKNFPDAWPMVELLRNLGFNAEVIDPKWGTGERVVVVRVNDKLLDALGIDRV